MFRVLYPIKIRTCSPPRTRGWETRQPGCWPDMRGRLRVSHVPCGVGGYDRTRGWNKGDVYGAICL